MQPLIEQADEVIADAVEEAVEALGRIPTPQSLSFLIERLRNPQPLVRKAAALALGRSGDRAAAQPLEELLEHELDRTVFLAAAEALSRIRSGHPLHRLRKLMGRSKSGIERRELANYIGARLGKPGDFYKLLQAEPMHQEDMIARLLREGRRLLGRSAVLSAADREYTDGQLDRALERFTREDYVGTIASLHRAASCVLHRAAASEQYASLLAGRSVRDLSERKAGAKVGLLLGASERLQANFGLLAGLHHDSRHHPPGLEEALLGMFALRQVADELIRLAGSRHPPPRAEGV